jgi:predicted DNA-binding protein
MAFDPDAYLAGGSQTTDFDPDAYLSETSSLFTGATTQFDPDAYLLEEKEDPSAGDIVKGVGVEVGAGIGGSVLGGILGGTLGSAFFGIGAVPGAAIGSALGGATASFFGSLLAQDIEGQEDKSMGRAIAAAAIGAIPGGVGKGIKGGITLGRVAGREAAKGAAFGVTDATARAMIDEGRLPTAEELAQFGGAGALFGGALGGVTTKIGQKFAGKTPQQIDDAIAREEITFKDLSFFPKDASNDIEFGEGVLLRGIQETKDGARSRAAAQALTQPQANLGTMGRILASVAPSKIVGTKAQQATIDFSRIIKTAEELSGRIGAKTARAIKKDPSLEAPINRFLDTGEMSDDVARVLGDDLTKYNEARVALQKEAIQLLDDGAYKSVDEKARKKLRDTIDDSMNSSQRYARREYEAFLNPNYKPTAKQKQAAMNELIEAGINRGEDFNTASVNAEKHLQRLEDSFASTKKEDPRRFLGNGIDSVFKKRKTPGEAEKAWLGEIKDPVERMRGTLTGIAKSVARERTNLILGKELVDAGIASTSKVDDEMIELVLRGSGKEGSGLYAYPQVQTALNELYVGNGSEKMDNIFLNGLQDLYRAGVGLSKGVKVLFNTVAYPVQVYGNTANLLGMGINPFNNASRGLRLALADVPLVSRAMEGLDKTPKARKALLDEIEEMSKYGIKNANILESDIRSTLDAGPFSKWLQKGLDPVGKAYQVPDTLGRYVGWKANQNTIRRMFPNASDEVVKKQAAMMINDTYQNYDKLSNVVRTLSRWGVMPQFASFTSEFARNQYNQGKMIARMLAGNFGEEFSELGAANVARMRIEGGKRLASLLGVYGGTYAAIEGVKAASGVDDKKEEALRDVAYAPWDKNRKQLVKLDEGGRTGWVANPSYVVPHALGLSALQAGLSGDSEQSVVGLLAEEFIGEGSFVFQSAYQALANRDERGELISKEVDKLDQARDRLGFFLTESFRPGFSRELKKLEKARLGKGDLTLKEVGARQLGARINPFDVGEAAMFTIRNTNTLSNEAKSDYNSLLKFGEASEAELNQAYERANKIYSDAFAALSKNNQSLITLGYDENERIEIFKNAKVSSKRILEILDNSPSDLPRALKKSTSDIYNEMGDTMQQKRSNIKKEIRKDPIVGKRLMNMWIREQKNASKGLNQKDTLIRNMDTDEKVDYLSRNPSMISEFRRKGLLSDSVIQALRIRGLL